MPKFICSRYPQAHLAFTSEEGKRQDVYFKPNVIDGVTMGFAEVKDDKLAAQVLAHEWAGNGIIVAVKDFPVSKPVPAAPAAPKDELPDRVADLEVIVEDLQERVAALEKAGKAGK